MATEVQLVNKICLKVIFKNIDSQSNRTSVLLLAGNYKFIVTQKVLLQMGNLNVGFQ